MKRIFEFLCDNSHITERYVDEAIRTDRCSTCGKDALRIVSKPRIALEGITGAFPGAADAWVRKRAEKLKQEQKTAAEQAQAGFIFKCPKTHTGRMKGIHGTD